MKKIITIVFAIFCNSVFASSTIIPTVPSANSPLLSAPVRGNFLAAYNDINNILNNFAGSSAPINPSNYQYWLNTTSTPFVLNIFDGVNWVAVAKLNISTHTWTPVGSYGGATVTVPFGGTGATTMTGLVFGNGTSAMTPYAGTSCTNQFVRSLNSSGVATCNSVSNSDLTNSSFTLGSTAISLGSTTTSVAGLTLTSPTLTGPSTDVLTLSGQLTSNVTTGTSPFVVSSTTNVANLNASSLSGATFASPGAIGGTTPGSGAFTTLSASGVITSTLSTGTAPLTVASTTQVNNLNVSQLIGSTWVSPGAIGSTTANTGKFTTLQATGAITPSTTAGIVGTTSADNANAGAVGEYASNSTSGTSATSGVTLNATSFSLTAGDWDVSGLCQTVPAGATTTTIVYCGINTTSATLGAVSTLTLFDSTIPAGGGANFASPTVRVNVSTTTTVYLVSQVTFAVSTMSVNGFIRARRVR